MLALAIKHLVGVDPKPGSGCAVVRDENGERISEWDESRFGSKPAKEALDQAYAEYMADPARIADARAARYRAEADPLLLAALGYQIEIEAGAKVEAKRDKAKTDYLAAKAKIRQEIPD